MLLFTANIIVHVEDPIEFTKKNQKKQKPKPNRTNMLIYKGHKIQGQYTKFNCISMKIKIFKLYLLQQYQKNKT